MGITNDEFSDNTVRKIKNTLTNTQDQRLTEPKRKFRVTIFYPVTYTIAVRNRFGSMKAVIVTYRVVQPYFLATPTEIELGMKLIKLHKDFKMTSLNFPVAVVINQKCLQIRVSTFCRCETDCKPSFD